MKCQTFHWVSRPCPHFPKAPFGKLWFLEVRRWTYYHTCSCSLSGCIRAFPTGSMLPHYLVYGAIITHYWTVNRFSLSLRWFLFKEAKVRQLYVILLTGYVRHSLLEFPNSLSLQQIVAAIPLVMKVKQKSAWLWTASQKQNENDLYRSVPKVMETHFIKGNQLCQHHAPHCNR